MKDKKWSLYNISNSRGLLLGISTLIVAFFHCYSYKFSYDIFMFLRKTGNVGVDIFLFLSALGLYFSFTKDSNVKNFYKKRLLRIVPAIIIVEVIYYLYIGVTIKEFLENIFLISFYINGNRDFWYFSLLIVLYLLFPLLYKVINKYKLKGLIMLLVVTIGSTILCMLFIPSLYKMIEIALTRIPVFLIGIYVGQKVFNKEDMPIYLMPLFLIMFIISFILLFKGSFKYYIIVRYLYCFLAISMIFIISFINSFISQNIIKKCLEFFATYSMEVYLIFEKLALEVRKVMTVHNNFIFYLIIFIITMILSFGLKKLCNVVVNVIEKKPKKLLKINN